MTAALITRDDSRLSVSWTAEAQRLKDEALVLSSVIGRVTNVDEQAEAVAAQRALKAVLNDCEKARVACKDPVLHFGRVIDATAKKFCEDLHAEMERISAAVRDFVNVQEQQRRAAEALRLKELADIERRKQEELAKAQTVEQIDAVQEKFNEEAKVAQVPLQVVRAEGQVVREDWEVNVVDIWALAKADPECITITPRLSTIKQRLNAGVRLPGVEAVRVKSSTVRVAGQREPLRIA